jgi:pimeloyl-ACP methyl ester carboxylesterase
MATSEVPIVLVHGGGHGAWCWAPTLGLLDGSVIAVDLPPVSIRGGPGRNEMPEGIDELTVADWADSVLAAADGAGFDRFVLVGHSLAGLTIGEVARVRPDRVAHLVFVSALAPRQGENALSAMAPEMMERVSGGLTDEVVAELFCNDMDATQTQFVLDRFGTDAAQVMLEPIDRVGIPPELPKTYVRLARDQALTPAAQEASIAALRAVPGGTVDIKDIDSGHNVMISHPAELARVIQDLR